MKKRYGVYNVYDGQEHFCKSLKQACREAFALGTEWMVEVRGVSAFDINLCRVEWNDTAEGFEARCRALVKSLGL